MCPVPGNHLQDGYEREYEYAVEAKEGKALASMEPRVNEIACILAIPSPALVPRDRLGGVCSLFWIFADLLASLGSVVCSFSSLLFPSLLEYRPLSCEKGAGFEAFLDGGWLRPSLRHAVCLRVCSLLLLNALQ